jgi:O-antigen ligase
MRRPTALAAGTLCAALAWSAWSLMPSLPPRAALVAALIGLALAALTTVTGRPGMLPSVVLIVITAPSVAGPSWLRVVVVAGIALGVAAEVLRNPEIAEPEPRFSEVPGGQE